MVQGIDELGFLPGWGNTVGRVRESFQLLLDIVQARSVKGCCGAKMSRLLVLASTPRAVLLRGCWAD